MLILLPLEVATGVLFKLTQLLIDSFNIQSGDDAPELLNVITDPLTDSIIQVEGLVPRHASTVEKPLIACETLCVTVAPVFAAQFFSESA